jgi:lysophospholipid acyltransferase (LPLAT)-like uncharacterized protein
MKFRKIKQNVLRFIGNYISHFGVTILCKTLHIEKQNFDGVQKLMMNNESFILGFWHGTMMAPWYVHRNNHFSALVSTSKDGELLSRMLDKWNYKVVRGSSNIGGKEALQILLDEAENNYSIAITPDGPTGPQFEMKAGAVVLAKKTRMPLVLLGTAYSKYFELNSWDKFQIPKPFSKVCMYYSDPILVDEKLSYEETSEKIKKSEELLNNLQEKAKINC